MPTTYAIPDGRVAMAATLYTGNSSTQTISNAVNGVSMQPDFVWVKSRSLGTTNESYHFLVDVVQGLYSGSVYNYLNSNTAASQNNSGSNVPTSYGGVTSLNSNGFSVTGAGSGTYTNQSAATYVAWQWKGGGAAVSNTAGNITSSVSANATAGFSVVTYTGAGGGSDTVGHGLGVAPSIVIFKPRSAAADWYVYSSTLGASKYLSLNSAAAAGTASNFFSGMTSSVIGLGYGAGSIDASGTTFVAYCFAPVAGYSAFGSYTGNGSADGPFVYLGFRPRFLLIRGTHNADWYIFDSARNTSNLTDKSLASNLAFAEDTNPTYISLDMLSNGFKPRQAYSYLNGSGNTYIYMAFAENPFKYANAR